MIDLDEVENIHKILIDHFGGVHGLRDHTALDSALKRPFQTFNNADLYPTILEKASALTESLLINHPFIDGNKRVAYTVLRLYLLENGYDFCASQDEKYAFIVNLASGKIKYQQALIWLKNNTTN
jgi:death-on-curing protein